MLSYQHFFFLFFESDTETKLLKTMGKLWERYVFWLSSRFFLKLKIQSFLHYLFFFLVISRRLKKLLYKNWKNDEMRPNQNWSHEKDGNIKNKKYFDGSTNFYTIPKITIFRVDNLPAKRHKIYIYSKKFPRLVLVYFFILGGR